MLFHQIMSANTKEIRFKWNAKYRRPMYKLKGPNYLKKGVSETFTASNNNHVSVKRVAEASFTAVSLESYN